MITELHNTFHRYLVDHNPELIINLPPQVSISQYIREKLQCNAEYLDELLAAQTAADETVRLCMERLTADLRPSRYFYLKEILEEDFPGDYLVMREAGTLTYEIVTLITVCCPIFKTIGFCETDRNNRILRYAIIGQMREYLGATKV